MKVDKSNRDPLYLSIVKIHSIKKSILFSYLLPIPFIYLGYFALNYFDKNWYHDIFLVSIMVLFVIGQYKFLRDLIVFHRVSNKNLNVLEVLYNNFRKLSIDELINLLNSVKPSHLRDLIIKWLKLFKLGNKDSIINLMDNAANKRIRGMQNNLSFHVILNRTILKMGFLGTLIGLLLTFPPMKSAVLALQSSEGEFKFVNDIAKAIDGDQYAILTTLIATGFSLFIEFLVLRILQGILNGLEEINDNVDEWVLVELLPLMENKTKEMEIEQKYQKNLDSLLHLMVNVEKQINKLVEVEDLISKKIQKLEEYEKQYRTIINLKTQAISPDVEVHKEET